MEGMLSLIAEELCLTFVYGIIFYAFQKTT